MWLPTVLSPLFCCSVAGIPSSSTGSVALCEEVCQDLMDYGICVLPKCERHWMLIMPESYFSSFFFAGRNACWCLHAVQLLCVQVIPHYYAENISLAHLCELHGWSLRTNPRRVFDAVMFSNEIDLLEIRLQVFLQFFFNWLIDSFHIEWLHKLIAHELNCSHLLLLLSVRWARWLCLLFKKFPYLLKCRHSVWFFGQNSVYQ